MTVNKLIKQLQELQAQDKGDYEVCAHDTDGFFNNVNKIIVGAAAILLETDY